MAIRYLPYTFSSRFACFNCRKAFSYETEWKDWKAQTQLCPDCGQALWYMGRKFKPPRRRDIKQWRKVEMIRKSGRHYYPKYLWQAKNCCEELLPKREGNHDKGKKAKLV